MGVMNRKRLLLLFLLIVVAVPIALAADYWICPDCGKRVREVAGDMCPYCGYERHVHDWAPATCVSLKTCRICGETEGAPDPSNHAGETELRNRKEATCREAGYTGDTYCTGCQAVIVQGKVIPASEHQWVAGDILREPTCREPGRQRWTCAVCGETEERTLPVDPARHRGGTELRNEAAATCGQPGYTGDTYCRDCGELVLPGRTLPATGQHDWQDATCTEPKTCRVCSRTEGEPAGHTWDEGQVIHAPTCKVSGVTRFTCAACGLTKSTVVPADPDRHTWNEGEVIYPAACAAEGLIHYTCTSCGKEQDELLPLDPDRHGDTELRGEKAATCTEAGYSGDSYCKDCGRKLGEGQAIPAAGHSWNQGETIREATCIDTGVIRYSCTVCGETKDDILPIDQTNHAGAQEIRNVIDAACEEDGYTGDAYCTACGAKITEGATIPATGHNWQEATTTAPKTCRVCGKTEGKPLPADKAGDIVMFGRYEQDNNKANGPEAIAWQVLDVDKTQGKALLISKYGLEVMSYHKVQKNITWEMCTLRAWLNKDFLNTAFTNTEQTAILTTEVVNNKYQGYIEWNTDGGKDVQDKVFLLSYEEANHYFGGVKWDDSDNMESRASATAYVKAQGAGTWNKYKTKDGQITIWWWLRSPGYQQYHAAVVNNNGCLSVSDVSVSSGCVRPAIWINIESDVFR